MVKARPAELGHSTYAPTEFWIWKSNTEDRESFHSFKLDLEVQVRGTYSRNSGSMSPVQVDSKTIYRPQGSSPPLIGLKDKIITCNKDTQTVEAGIVSQGDWKYVNEDKPDWISSIKPIGGKKLSMVLAANETGVIRQAEFTISRHADGKKIKPLKLLIVQYPTSVVK